MKAVKINMSEKSSSKAVKAVICGVLVSFIIILLMTTLVSLFMVISGSLFENAAGYIMLVPLILGGYIGGYVGARIKKESGMLVGAVVGFIAFITLMILGFIVGSNVTYMLLLKALALILPSAIGGVKGVNKKEKLKIS